MSVTHPPTSTTHTPRHRRSRPNRKSHSSSAEPVAKPALSGFDGAGDARHHPQRNRRSNRSAMSTRPSKRRGASPLNGAASDDNHKRKSNGDHLHAEDARKNPFAMGRDGRPKKPGQGASRFSKPDSNSTAFDVDEDAYPMDSTSPLANEIYGQLKRDKIFPPKWPDDLSSKAAMAKLREDHRAYRDRARESLVRANLIDAPGVQKKLEDALDFKGICEDMCPEYEMITRIIEPDIPSAEKDQSTGSPDPEKMIKKLARSAAGQETPLPMDVLSVACLRRTLDYLIDDLLQSDSNLPILHGYLWDRTRALRRDFTFHSKMEPHELRDQVYCYETIIRFHVTALHLLSQKSLKPEEFSEQQELEQLSKTLLSLTYTYDACQGQGIICENEAEFRAYHGLFFANKPDIQDAFQRAQGGLANWKNSDEVRTAISLIETLQTTTAWHGPLGAGPSMAIEGCHTTYFRIIEDPSVSYTMACFAEIHFGQLRRSILQTLNKGLRRPRNPAKDTTPSYLNSFLKFDHEDQAIEFIENHGLEFVPHEDYPNDPSKRYLAARGKLSQPRLRHTFSKSLVEKKRGNRSLPEVLRETFFEDPQASAFSQPLGSGETGLFTRDTGSKQSPFSQGPGTAVNGFGTQAPKFGSAAGISTSGTSPFAKPATTSTTPGNPFQSSPFAQPSTQPASSLAATQQSTTNGASAFKSPFATASTPVDSSTSAGALTGNPFSSTTIANGSTAKTPSPFSSSPFAAPTKEPATVAPSTFGSPFSQNAVTTSRPQESSAFKSPFSQPTTTEVNAKPSVVVTNATPDATSSQPISAFSTAEKNTTVDSAQPSAPVKSSSPFAGLNGATQNAAKLPSFSTAASTAPSFQNDKPTFNFQSTQGGNGLSSLTTTQKPFPTFAPTIGTSSTAPLSEVPSIQNQDQTATTSASTSSLPASTTTGVQAQQAFPPFKALQGASAVIPSAPTSQATSVLNATSAAPAAPQINLAPVPPPPKQDLFGDFTNWFVNGDGGLLSEFTEYIVSQIVQDTFTQFVKDEEERKRKEEEAMDSAKAWDFRAYNLQVRYFYRWREIARKMRLRRRRLQDKEDYKAYLVAKQAEEAAKKKQAKEASRTQAAALKRSKIADHVKEFRDLLETQRNKPQEQEDALLASGVLSGVADERQAVADIVHHEEAKQSDETSRSSYRKSLPNGSSFGFSRSMLGRSVGGSKTQALRDEYSKDSANSFRRSLSPSSSFARSWRVPSSSPGDQAKRTSKVSDRWRLKAMGLVTMPDGTALPEKLANSMRYEGKRYEGWGSFGLDRKASQNNHRRSTSVDVNHSASVRSAFEQSFRASSDSHKRPAAVLADSVGRMSPPSAKRKRVIEEVNNSSKKRAGSGAGAKDDGAGSGNSSIERILREARELRNSLRDSKEDLDETTDWFKGQSEIMQQEDMLSSRRSSSVWEQ